MAIHGYFGLPGAGKSYGVVEYVVIPSLKEGRQVVTNIPLEGSLLTSVFGGEVLQLPDDWHEVEDLSSLCPPGCVLILDEVWRKWPAGLNVNRVPKHEMALLKEHRHRVSADGKAMRVVLVTQQPSDLANWTRKLIEVSYRMEKLTALGSSKRFRVDIYKTCPTGDYPPKRLLIRQTQGTYKPEIHQYYQSATQSESSTLNVGDETIADKRGTIWRSPWLLACLAAGMILPIVGFMQVVAFFNPASVEPQSKQAFVNPPPPAAITSLQPGNASAQPVIEPAVNPPPPDHPPYSKLWRVGGYVSLPDKDAPPSPKWPSIVGYNAAPESISMTQGVILRSPRGSRIVSMDFCKPLKGTAELYCDIDGERITSWTGASGTDAVVDSAVSHASSGI